MVDDPYDLHRFTSAQDSGNTFARALEELRQGRKSSHWMWFVFPQIAGLGQSPTAKKFALSSRGEAQEYLRHPVLGPRLLESTGVVAETEGRTVAEIFGRVDALKLHSSMTLFMRVAPDGQLFWRVINRYYKGIPDPATDVLLCGERTAGSL
jgi:uncharacterized protein (DUF1810 family)